MYNDRFLEHPEITHALAWGYPKGPGPEPHCPVCSEVCAWVYKDVEWDIIGCENCHEIFIDDEIREYDAWQEEDCFA